MAAVVTLIFEIRSSDIRARNIIQRDFDDIKHDKINI